MCNMYSCVLYLIVDWYQSAAFTHLTPSSLKHARSLQISVNTYNNHIFIFQIQLFSTHHQFSKMMRKIMSNLLFLTLLTAVLGHFVPPPPKIFSHLQQPPKQPPPPPQYQPPTPPQPQQLWSAFPAQSEATASLCEAMQQRMNVLLQTDTFTCDKLPSNVPGR